MTDGAGSPLRTNVSNSDSTSSIVQGHIAQGAKGYFRAFYVANNSALLQESCHILATIGLQICFVAIGSPAMTTAHRKFRVYSPFFALRIDLDILQ